MPISTNSNEMETKSNKTETKSSKTDVEICQSQQIVTKWKKSNKTEKYTGLEHRQTLRACDLPCNLQIEIEN